MSSGFYVQWWGSNPRGLIVHFKDLVLASLQHKPMTPVCLIAFLLGFSSFSTNIKENYYSKVLVRNMGIWLWFESGRDYYINRPHFNYFFI